MERELKARVFGKGQKLLSVNLGRFEICQPVYADNTALVTDSKEKLCKLVNKFGRVCARRKLRANAGTSKVMRCSRYGNEGRMHVRLNGLPFEEVDCVEDLGSQEATDGGCERDVVHRMNEQYRAWGAPKGC